MFETPIHWVPDIEPHRLGLMARALGGEDLGAAADGWRRARVDIVVSLLESAEVRELELRRQQASALNGRSSSVPIR